MFVPRFVAIVSAVLLLAGCSPSTTTAPQPEPTSPTPSANFADDAWNTVLTRYPDAARPDVALVRYAAPIEIAQLQVDCMHDEGFDATLTPDGGVSVMGIPAEQQEALAIAQYACSVRYQIDPQYTDPLSGTELGDLYDYFVDDLIPCLESHGYPVTDAPSRATFVDTYASAGWTPYEAVGPTSQQEWYDLNDACPQWPDGFWG